MKTKHYVALATAFVFVLFSAACKKSHDNSPNPTDATGIKLTSNATFGNILTDNNGRALYFFSDDAGTTSTCYGGCAVVWPVFYQENPTFSTGLASTDFGVITRTDGSKQTTYKGWPLYYYQPDQPGDVKGDGVGKNWFVAKADYSVMVAYGQLAGHDGNQYTSAGVAGQESSQYITDANGHTLYLFTRDGLNKNNFSNGDATHDAIWPIYSVPSVQSIPSILDKTQFGTITVFGNTQLVYKGHPLYYFGQDSGVKGSTKGVSFPTPGAAIWKIINASTVAATNL